MMLDSSDLWSLSRPWRWVTVLTVGASVLIVLLLVRQSHAGASATASYVPPPIVAAPGNGMALAAMGVPASAAGVTPRSSPESHDPVFDVPVARPVVSRFPSDTELHALGVYKGAPPTGQKDVPWWAKCTGEQGDSAVMRECHSKYAGQRTVNAITVNVRRGQKPVVLALMSYEPVLWKIDGADSGNIQQIILAGYYGQDIAGVPASVPVIAQTHEASTCQSCARQAGHFYAYDEKSSQYRNAIDKLEAQTGLRLASFQGSHEANLFTVSSSTIAARDADPAEAYLDKEFSGTVSLAGSSVMLPDGIWQGVAFEKGKTGAAGDDAVLVLAQLDGVRLNGVVAVRVRNSLQRQGFKQHQACSRIKGYLVKADMNEPFGPQLCEWVTHVTDPWVQPIFAVAADKLTALGVGLPDTVIASSLHQADMATSRTVVYYSNPELKGLRAPRASWEQSEWHVSRLQGSPERKAFVDEQVKVTGFWYQILQAEGR